MKYTCGLYGTADLSLDEAQTAKLRFIARRLGLRGGERVLDIGAGWAPSPAIFAAEYGCEVVAVTPSRVQIDHLTERAATPRPRPPRHHRPALRVRPRTRTAPSTPSPSSAFIEHLRRPPRRPRHRRPLAAPRRDTCTSPRAATAAQWHRAVYAPRPASRDVAENIFGHADLRPLSALLAAVEDTGLSLVSTTDLTRDYRRPCGRGPTTSAPPAPASTPLVPGLADKLLRYLETTEAGWGRTTKHYAFTAVRSRWGHHEETA
ncbi:SAM-dependent methyltransferase [Streptomyces clavuligerus]|uniref:SAM-dependent methyltransferase n=1 Tax=Streptomyces clavuligerus TaxID=1901 RepID=UPI001F0829E9|nr:class I SAM-dependent methyltransferase [Streptomyces clavuligerus]